MSVKCFRLGKGVSYKRIEVSRQLVDDFKRVCERQGVKHQDALRLRVARVCYDAVKLGFYDKDLVNHRREAVVTFSVRNAFWIEFAQRCKRAGRNPYFQLASYMAVCTQFDEVL